jgi:hypothetical protein
MTGGIVQDVMGAAETGTFNMSGGNAGTHVIATGNSSIRSPLRLN